jgi:hypothetical protein
VTAADVRPPEPSHRSSIGVVLAVSVIVFAVVLGVIVVLRQPSPPSTASYDDATRSAFVSSCVSGGGETRPTCECAYDKIVQSIPYDRYLELNRQIDDQRRAVQAGSTEAPGGTGMAPRSTTALPNDIEVMIVSCIARQAVTTVTTATTVTTMATVTTTPASASLTIVTTPGP